MSLIPCKTFNFSKSTQFNSNSLTKKYTVTTQTFHSLIFTTWNIPQTLDQHKVKLIHHCTAPTPLSFLPYPFHRNTLTYWHDMAHFLLQFSQPPHFFFPLPTNHCCCESKLPWSLISDKFQFWKAQITNHMVSFFRCTK